MSSSYPYDVSIMFRVYYDAEPEVWLEDWVDGWLDGWDEWEEPHHSPNESPTLVTADEDADEEDSPDYYRASWWFSWEHDPASMFDALIRDDGSEGTLPDACDWSRVGYHQCDHPSDEREGCSWDDVREHGDVPDGVPTMDVPDGD